MKRIGTISYNIYCNFTNYGSALQTWALHQAVKKVGKGNYQPVLADYCPDILLDKDPLNPFQNMWDKDEQSRRNCELTMPAIRENFYKFDKFYRERFDITSQKYTSENFHQIVINERLDGFICGSDTIFCIDEFEGFDNGYYAQFPCMQKNSIAYAASFGDSHFDEQGYQTLNARLKNFKAIGLRENDMLPYVTAHTDVPVARTIDPTLLLTDKDYNTIAEKRLDQDKYLLLYARRYNPKMEAYAEKIAAENGWKIIEISLRATNAEKPNRRMYYEAGVEEFLSLVKYAEFVVTNSFHGLIFAVQYKCPMNVFSREQADTKILELLKLFGLKERMLVSGEEEQTQPIDYVTVHQRIDEARQKSLQFLRDKLQLF